MLKKMLLENIFIKSFFIFALVLLAPLSQLLAFNWSYFNFSVLELLIAVSAISLLGASLFALFGTVISRKSLLFFLKYILVLTAFSVFVIPINLPAIEGAAQMDWMSRKEAQYVFIYGLIVFVILFLYSLRNKVFSTDINKLFDALALLSSFYIVGLLGYAIVNAPRYIELTGIEKNPTYEWPVSSKQNIFLISFDGVQGSLVNGMLKKDENIASIFDGFTFFPNALATYTTTQVSLGSVLLGRLLNNKKEFDHSVLIPSEEGLLQNAQNAGFKVFVRDPLVNKPLPGFFTLNGSKKQRYNYTNISEALRHSFNLAVGLDIGKALSLFDDETRALPDELKQFEHQADFGQLLNMISNLYTENGDKRLYFMHFLGTHDPYFYNERCEIESYEAIKKMQNISGAISGAKCVVMMLDSFFKQLKRHNIYDQSLIIVYSDHGTTLRSYAYKQMVDTQYADYFNKTRACLIDGEGTMFSAGRYNPMLFYKPISSKGSLQVNEVTVSLIDIAPTVCGLITCAKQNWAGISLERNSDIQRSHSFWLYLGGQNRIAQDGSDKFHAGLDKYWEKRSFNGALDPNLAIAMGCDLDVANGYLNISQPVFFTVAGSRLSGAYISEGWSGQELGHRWTDGPRAELVFQIKDYQKKDLLLSIYAGAYLGGGLPHQNIKVSVNGTEVAQWKMARGDVYEARIPASLVKEDGLLKVAFDISDPRAPIDYDPNNKDPRKLGMAISELVIDYAD